MEMRLTHVVAIALALGSWGSVARGATDQKPAAATAKRADTLADDAMALTKERRFEDAAAAVRESLAIRERLFGKSSVEAADSLDVLGFVFYSKGDFFSAEEPFKRALAIRRLRP